ncbi:MAG: hypothetical protein Q8O67_09145 [Deltaproteobacteria bacterium]|nr:hypothetical protein [Deltaproteobacteria bacterium]
MPWLRVVVVVVVVFGPGCVDVPPLPGSVVVCVGAEDCPGGLVCDLDVHECRAEGQKAPAVVDVVVTPALINLGAVSIVIRADTALDPALVPLVEFAAGSPSLPFIFAGVDGAEARLTLDVDAGVAEGVYELAAVEIVSAAGVRGRRALAATSLRVDRTPPGVFGAVILEAPADRTWANGDVVTVAFSANEAVDLARTHLVLDALIGGPTCVADADDGGFRCTLVIPVDAPDGAIEEPRVVVVDAAGNESSVVVGAAIKLDTAAPALVTDSVRLLITTGGRPSAAASPASVVSVSFIVSEPLGQPPVVTLVDAGVPLSLRSEQGQSYTYELITGVQPPPGAHPIAAVLEDRFGHAVTVQVVDDVPFSAGNASCPPAPGTSCVDVDGDGHALRDPIACPDGDDLDDLDPSVSPAAIELPGDGRDNDQIGGDQPIDENAGVFVDVDDGDDANEGSRAAPVRSLNAGVDRLGTRRFLFLSASTQPHGFADGTLFTQVSLIGGLDPADGWRRTGGRSAVADELADGGEPIVYEGVDGLGGGDFTTSVQLVRTGVVGRVFFTDTRGGVLLDSDVADLFLDSSSVDVVRSRIGGINLFDSDISISTTEVREVVNLVNSTVTGINAYFASGIVTGVNSFGDVTLFHSTAIGDGVAAISLRTGGSVRAVASVLVRTNSGPVVDVDSDDLTLVGCNLSNGGGSLIDKPESLAINGCPVLADGCFTSGNRSDPPGFATVFHLSSSSALVDDGVVAAEFGAPFAMAADFDGDCRYADGAADIGADEAL